MSRLAADPTRRRLLAMLLAAALLAGACADDSTAAGDGPASGAARTAPLRLDQVASSPREDVVAALVFPQGSVGRADVRGADPSFGPAGVDADELRSGGPPPDGIPSIDEPRFHRVADPPALADREPVLALRVGDDARAYPLRVMVWHEIVNDTVDGVPVTVTYCPLCNSALAFDRRHAGRVLDFGVSGLLHHSSLVMYDRQTRSLWSHFTGDALLGHLAGGALTPLPVAITSWAEFRDANPDGHVLSAETGHARDYGRNPYPGYDDVDTPPFLFDGEVDGRHAAKTRVIAVRDGERAVAVVADRLERERAVPFVLGSRALVAWFAPGTASALDTARIVDGRDVGTTRVFESVVDGRALSFAPFVSGGFRDRETGSEWTTSGEATTGPLAGRRLVAVPHVDTFWFAWTAFEPDTVVVG